MPDVPKGAKKPKDHQSIALKPDDDRPEGWDLLRPPIDLEFWEVTDFTALVANIKTRGDAIEINASNMRAIGGVVKQLQQVFALDSTAFRTWLREKGPLDEQATALLPLIFQYASALGEVLSSEK